MMRMRFVCVAFAAWLLSGPLFSHAQEIPTDNRAPFTSCSAEPVHQQPPSGPEISIANVTFSGFIQMLISDQEEIAESIKSERYAHSLDVDGVVNEALEKAKVGWQNHGYFKAEVSGAARTLAASATNIQAALFIHVEEGVQYRLGGITFKNNRAVWNSAKLRNVFPLKDGEIFRREMIEEGLESLRKLYGEFGYVNYTAVPSTTFDDEKKQAYLEIDADEGKQFYVSRIDVEDIGGIARQEALKELAIQPGDIYNSYLWELSLRRVKSLFPYCDCRSDRPMQLDERKGTVALRLDFLCSSQ